MNKINVEKLLNGKNLKYKFKNDNEFKDLITSERYTLEDIMNFIIKTVKNNPIMVIESEHPNDDLVKFVSDTDKYILEFDKIDIIYSYIYELNRKFYIENGYILDEDGLSKSLYRNDSYAYDYRTRILFSKIRPRNLDGFFDKNTYKYFMRYIFILNRDDITSYFFNLANSDELETIFDNIIDDFLTKDFSVSYIKVMEKIKETYQNERERVKYLAETFISISKLYSIVRQKNYTDVVKECLKNKDIREIVSYNIYVFNRNLNYEVLFEFIKVSIEDDINKIFSVNYYLHNIISNLKERKFYLFETKNEKTYCDFVNNINNLFISKFKFNKNELEYKQKLVSEMYVAQSTCKIQKFGIKLNIFLRLIDILTEKEIDDNSDLLFGFLLKILIQCTRNYQLSEYFIIRDSKKEMITKKFFDYICKSKRSINSYIIVEKRLKYLDNFFLNLDESENRKEIVFAKKKLLVKKSI